MSYKTIISNEMNNLGIDYCKFISHNENFILDFYGNECLLPINKKFLCLSFINNSDDDFTIILKEYNSIKKLKKNELKNKWRFIICQVNILLNKIFSEIRVQYNQENWLYNINENFLYLKIMRNVQYIDIDDDADSLTPLLTSKASINYS